MPECARVYELNVNSPGGSFVGGIFRRSIAENIWDQSTGLVRHSSIPAARNRSLFTRDYVCCESYDRDCAGRGC